ncbi:protein of unknown function (plasmid) [Paraburkholderia dioscoreae]|uniref:Uncharacterized protein n=2 Tax=Paraburkholderia dioscoreae TaxID=2604047 RepID=A0A5Q4Z2R7_9BURK|nr:protein of unknown function [Paraburkholderia dioscoreae]
MPLLKTMRAAFAANAAMRAQLHSTNPASHFILTALAIWNTETQIFLRSAAIQYKYPVSGHAEFDGTWSESECVARDANRATLLTA